MPDRVSEAMQLQVEAERNRRAKVLESEGRSRCLWSRPLLN